MDRSPNIISVVPAFGVNAAVPAVLNPASKDGVFLRGQMTVKPGFSYVQGSDMSYSVHCTATGTEL